MERVLFEPREEYYWIDDVMLSRIRRDSASRVALFGMAWCCEWGRGDQWLEPFSGELWWADDPPDAFGYVIRLGDRQVGMRGIKPKLLGTYWPERGVYEHRRETLNELAPHTEK